MYVQQQYVKATPPPPTNACHGGAPRTPIPLLSPTLNGKIRSFEINTRFHPCTPCVPHTVRFQGQTYEINYSTLTIYCSTLKYIVIFKQFIAMKFL